MIRVSLLRTTFDLALFVGLFIFPFWLFASVAILGLIIVPYFFEFLIAFASLELLYRGTIVTHYSIYLTLGVVIFFIIVQALRIFIRERAMRF